MTDGVSYYALTSFFAFYLLYRKRLSNHNNLIYRTMGKIGIFETILLLTLVVTIILLLVLAANKYLLSPVLRSRAKIF